jgi:site-specific DNA recombinase
MRRMLHSCVSGSASQADFFVGERKDTTMTTKIAASYARTSKEADDAFSVASQLAANRQYAQQHNATLPPEYEFAEDYTGKVIDRPELNKIRRLVRDRAITMLIVYATDRLARKVGVADFLLDECFDHGVELHIVAWGGPVRDTPEDRMRFNFESTFGDYERRKIVERTTRGKLQKLTGSDGIPAAWLGGSPIDKYGFKKEGSKRHTRLRIVEEEASIIRDIFTAFHTGVNVHQIARDLEATGVPTRGKAKAVARIAEGKNISHYIGRGWTRHDIYKILREEAYTGVFYANQNQRVYTDRTGKPTTKSRVVTRHRDEWIRLEFPELRIIEQQLFDEVQVLLSSGRQRNAPQPKHEYLMARRIRCTCGYATAVHAMNTQRQTKNLYYQCGAKRDRVKNKDVLCSIPTVRADLLDSKVWERLERFLRDPQEQLETLRQAQADIEKQHGEALARMREAEATRAEYRRRLAVYSDQEAEGLITRDMLRERKAELDKRLAAAEVVYREYEQLLAGKVLTDGEIGDILHDLEELRDELERMGELTFVKRRRLIEAMNITGKMAIEEQR